MDWIGSEETTILVIPQKLISEQYHLQLLSILKGPLENAQRVEWMIIIYRNYHKIKWWEGKEFSVAEEMEKRTDSNIAFRNFAYA